MLSLDQARVIVAAALSHARARSYPPMTVAVLDAAADLVAFEREDRSGLLRERIARGKAHGALNMGVGSRALASRAATHPQFVHSLVAMSGGWWYLFPAGYSSGAPRATSSAPSG